MAPVAHGQYPRRQPNGLWRGSSAMVMGLTGAISKGFLNGFNNVEVVGLDKFVDILESRKDPYQRERGLITVSNHISVLDDPLIWGILPLKMSFEPWNHRWSLGAHDICFKNKTLGTFFSLGQVLPTHRSLHSTYASLFQPSFTQAIRLLSAYPFKSSSEHTLLGSQPTTVTRQSMLESLRDPFSEGSLIYSTTGKDLYIAPSAFLSNRYSWVHIFPEGLVHQQKERSMRYFKWGVSRMILEAEPMPDVVPMFIDGTADIMPEPRPWPRFIPGVGKNVRVAFGDKVDTEAVFGDLRRRWKALVKKSIDARDAAAASSEKLAKEKGLPLGKKQDVLRVGELPDDLKFSTEAEEIRIEVTRRVRDEVLKVRKSLGYPDEDPKLGLAETWARVPKDTTNSPIDGGVDKPST